MPDRQLERHKQIQDAAYAVLAEKGYRAASMLAVAKRAGASNETLYSWYGTKQNLFRTLIEDNASEVAGRLRAAIRSGADAVAVLAQIGPMLLLLVTSEKAIALSRAAAADASDTGLLGQTLAEAGRGTIRPLIQELLERARHERTLGFQDEDAPADVYISLLIGDLQIRCATGALASLRKAEAVDRAGRALGTFLKLFAQ